MAGRRRVAGGLRIRVLFVFADAFFGSVGWEVGRRCIRLQFKRQGAEFYGRDRVSGWEREEDHKMGRVTPSYEIEGGPKYLQRGS